MTPSLAREHQLRISLLAFLTVLAIPLIQLSTGPAWMYTPDGFDAWFYHGYFLHLKHHIAAFSDDYYSSRLAWILPGYIAHTLFSPLTANFLLRLYLYWIATVSVYFLIQRSYGRRCAVICSLLLAGCSTFLCAAGWDYVDGAGIAYGLLCVEEFAASGIAAQSSRTAAARRATLAGAAFAAAVHSNIFLLILGPVIAVVFLARAGKQGISLALPALGGFTILTGALGIVSAALGGKFLFFMPSLTFAFALRKGNTYYADPSLWVSGAWWLVIPFAVASVSVLFLAWMALRRGSDDEPRAARVARMADLASLPLLLLIFFCLNAKHNPVLEYHFYASYLLVFTPLSVGALVGRRLDSISKRRFIALAAGCVFVAMLVGSDIRSHLPPAIQSAYSFLRTLRNVSDPVLAATLAAGILLGIVIRHRLVATVIVAVVTGAVLNQLGTISTPEASSGAMRRADYLDTDGASRELGRLSQDHPLLFWYAYKPGPYDEYTSVSSTYLWATTLLGRNLPSLTDFRFDTIHVGTDVALMDDHESAIDQAIAGLRGHGINLIPVQRLRSSVNPTAFGIELLQVKALDSPPVVYTSEPSRDTLKPSAEIINYDLEGLLTHTGHSVYGTPPATPPALPRGVFKVTDPRDHFGIDFQPIDAKGSAPVIAVEVTAIDQTTDDRFGPVNMIFQNQDYKYLYYSGSLGHGEAQTLVALPAGTHAVRVAFLANDQGYIKFPAAVRLRAFTAK